VRGTDRRQIAWINQRHITEDALDEAITTGINSYNNFALPRLWGSGKHASADGTRWDLYEHGGIGYYHVSDNRCGQTTDEAVECQLRTVSSSAL
jgi:hypothetical protein